MRHYDKWGDPLPELRNALAIELQKMIPESWFKEPYKKFCRIEGKYAFMSLADHVLKTCPENITLAVDEAGTLSFNREEVKRDDYAVLTGDTLTEFTKDRGPDDLQGLLKRGFDSSNFKDLLLE